MLFMEKGIECLTSMIGVLYSGNFYVPMDIKTPIGRLDSILTTLENALILTDLRDRETLRKIGYTGECLVYEELLEEYTGRVDLELLAEIRRGVLDTNLMYIIFTSGSTGVPKGVAIMHRSLMDYVDAFLREVKFQQDDIIGNQTPFYADMSLKDIYMTLVSGATICIIPQKYFMTPKKLLQYLDDNRVTTLMWVPTAYRIVSQFDGLSKVKPHALKMLIFSGEEMPMPVFRYWREHYPEACFVQLYGPSEITGACTYYFVTGDDGKGNEPIPIGRPFHNTGILLLTEEDQVVLPDTPDVPGEICVYGTCLAAGYYNSPDKTSEVFVQNPLGKTHASLMYKTGDLGRWNDRGELIFLSRMDYQVKHGGRRVELGEIEAAAVLVPGVRACCCVHNREEDKLVLYFIGEMDETELSLSLRDKLPKYMIPTGYHRLEELPTLSNGKLDRKRMTEWENCEK